MQLSSDEGSATRAKTVGRPENFYPSPFFDLARNYLPNTVKDTFDWCTYYFLTSPVVHGVITKLSAYAVTDLIYGSSPLDEKYKGLFEETLSLRTFLVEFNLDRYTYGNAFASVVYPIKKYLTCQKCQNKEEIEKSKYKWRGGTFMLTCAKCGEDGPAIPEDQTLPVEHKIRLVRWNPKTITIKRNELTGELRYFYTLPRYLRNELQLNSRKTVETTPQAFLDAVSTNRIIELDPTRVFHSRRPSISREPSDSGWGTPILFPVMKDLFLLQVMKKAQEVVFMEHVVPFRSLFPEVRADGGNVYANINLSDWQAKVEKEIKQWKRDPAHIAVFPVPIGQQMMGGQGRSLSLYQDMRAYTDQIVASMGVPPSFYMGDAMYSGQNVSLRALENEFISNRQDLIKLVNFIASQLSRGLDLEARRFQFRDFKMADDLQKAQMDMNLAAQGRISWTTFLSSRGFDLRVERTHIEEEIKQQGHLDKKRAEAQAAAGAIGMRGQQAAQIEAQTGGPAQVDMHGPEPTSGISQSPLNVGQQPGMPADEQVNALVQEAQAMPEIQRYRMMVNLRTSNPQLYEAVTERLSSGGGQQQAPLARPLPEQRPPRAGPATAQI